MKIKITVQLDVDVAGFGEEYGYTMRAAEVREHIRSDINEALRIVPYAATIKSLDVK